MARRLALPMLFSVSVGLTVASAQSNADAGSTVRRVAGLVRAVSDWSLTLELSSKQIIVIDADSSTRVIGKGAQARDLLLRKGRPNLHDVVRAGDRVTVRYRRFARSLNAVEVRVDRQQ